MFWIVFSAFYLIPLIWVTRADWPGWLFLGLMVLFLNAQYA